MHASKDNIEMSHKKSMHFAKVYDAIKSNESSFVEYSQVSLTFLFFGVLITTLKILPTSFDKRILSAKTVGLYV